MPQHGFAKSFFPSLSKLEAREQALVTEFIQKFTAQHIRGGTKLERVNRTKFKNLWSARVNQELRAILYQEGDIYMFLHVGHHDAAYAWAERKSLVHDEASNRLQIIDTTEVEVEVEREVVVHKMPPLFAPHEDAYLLSLGVLPEWLPAVRAIRTEDQLLDLCPSLPEEVAEALIDVASGKVVAPPAPEASPRLRHRDAGRRFFVADNEDEVLAALNGTFEDWMLFLHPEQRRIVEGVFRGPAHVVGDAGTGKTIVALHRARELARRTANVLLVTFTRALADNLGRRLDRLCSPAERERIEVSTLHSQALRLARGVQPKLQPLTTSKFAGYLKRAAQQRDPSVSLDLVSTEWSGVIVPGGLTEWSGYRQASRRGRGHPLTLAQRYSIWEVVKAARTEAWKSGFLDWAGICGVAQRALDDGKVPSPHQAILVDELQDLGVAELHLVRALGAGRPDLMMLFGDDVQRIYERPGGLSVVQIDTTGRLFRLRTNYRTTDAIQRAAEAVLGESSKSHRDSRSPVRGPAPNYQVCATHAEEEDAAAKQVRDWMAEGIALSDIAVLARVDARLDSLRAKLVDDGDDISALVEGDGSGVRLGTIHSAKGLEFRAVVVVGCEEGTIPHEQTLQRYSDPLDVENALERERHLLYVGMTRAREELAVTWVGEPTRWLPVPEGP